LPYYIHNILIFFAALASDYTSISINFILI
jgi:hypothetical protein